MPGAAIQHPSPGRIVRYRLTADQAAKTNARRDDVQRNLDKLRRDRPGFQAHVGNRCLEAEIVPLLMVKVFSDGKVNGQAFLDGNDTLWVTSAVEGEGSGEWSWPPRA